MVRFWLLLSFVWVTGGIRNSVQPKLLLCSTQWLIYVILMDHFTHGMSRPSTSDKVSLYVYLSPKICYCCTWQCVFLIEADFCNNLIRNYQLLCICLESLLTYVTASAVYSYWLMAANWQSVILLSEMLFRLFFISIFDNVNIFGDMLHTVG